jgi:chromosome segregation ATPase
MSRKGSSWGSSQGSSWGGKGGDDSSDSWSSKGGGDSWGSSGDSWNSKKDDSWSQPSKGSGSSWGSSGGKGKSAQSNGYGAAAEAKPEAKVVKPPGAKPQQQQQQTWEPAWKRGAASTTAEEPAWKKAATESSWKKEEPAWKTAAASPAAGKAAPAKGAAKGALGKGAAQAEAKPDQVPIYQAKVEKYTKDAETKEKLVGTVLERAKKVLEDEKATPPALKSALDSLEQQQSKVSELSDSITKDVDAGRKEGAKVKDSVTEMQKILINVRKLLQQVVMHVGKLKPKITKAQADADAKAKETKDAAAFKPVLAKATKDVAAVESAVEAVGRKAKLVLAKPPEGEEELDKKTEPIATAANDAMKKYESTKAEMQEKFKGIQGYAPETKKSSMASFTELQKKLADILKTIKVYQNFKKELPKMLEGQKAIAEVTEMLTGHDAAITKAGKIAEKATIEREDVTSIEETLEPVLKAIQGANTAIAQKMRITDAATQGKLQELKGKGEELKKKMATVDTKIKAQKDVFKAEEAVEKATEYVEQAEAGIKQYKDAEMPFLTGVEVLEGEESETAFKECNEAITATASAVMAARNWLKSKLVECKGYEKELGDKTNEQLMALNTKIQTLDTQLTKSRKETSERKVGAAMASAVDAVQALEKKIKAVEVEAKMLKSSSLEEEDADSIKEAIEKTKTILNEASAAAAEAKKVAATKQKEAKAAPTDPMVKKINERIDASSAKLSAVRGSMGTAEKIIKIKAVIAAGETAMKEAESECAKAKKAAGKKFTVESIATLDESLATAAKSVKAVEFQVKPQLGGATPQAKEKLQALLDKKAEAQKMLDEVKAESKEKREEVLSESFVEKAEENTKAVEAAATNMEEAEMPFLTGAGLELKARLTTITKCEEGIAAVKKAVDAANKYSTQKTGETRQFGEAVVKSIKEKFAAMAERIKKVSTKLPQFEKDLKERTKAAKVMEAEEMVKDFEAQVKEAAALADPFKKEGADKWTEAEAEKPLKAFMEADKQVGTKVASVKKFVGDRSREQTGNKENTEIIKQLQERITKAIAELTEARKPTIPHEQASMGTRLLAEAKEQVGALDGELKKASTASEPLLEGAGLEFLVSTSISTLATALEKEMKEKSLTVAEYWKEVGKGKTMGEKTFVAFIVGIGEKHDEVSAFTEERRAAIYKKLAKDGKSVKAADFASIFSSSYTCVKAVAVSKDFEVTEDSVCKVEPGAVVEISGVAKEDEAGMLRAECKVADKSGWITIKQKNVVFLSPTTAYKVYTQTLDAAVAECNSAIAKATASLQAKMKQGGTVAEGPLKTAREEMGKLKDDITKVQKDLDELKKKIAASRRDFATKERAEVNAHIEIRNQKEAAPFLEAPKAKLEALEDLVKAVEEAAAPLASLSGEELLAFTSPATVLEAVEKGNADVAAKANEAREALKEQVKAANEKTPPSGGIAEAKKQLSALQRKVQDVVAKTSKTLATIRAKCKAIVEPKSTVVAAAIRKHAMSKKLSGEALFDTLKDGEKISEDAFCKLVVSLKDAGISAEVARLVCRKVEADGISKDAFIKFVVLFYRVVKSIAFTDVFDITKCKTLRKVDQGEVLEMLDGPQTDESNGMTRIKAKSTIEPPTEGWVTISGSQGTAFMEECEKPKAKEVPKPKAVEKKA